MSDRTKLTKHEAIIAAAENSTDDEDAFVWAKDFEALLTELGFTIVPAEHALPQIAEVLT